MKLNAKLVIIMVSLLVLAMLTLFILNQYAQNDLVTEIQESSQEISKAVQMSIADLTSETETSRLTEYLHSAREKGINEINIIDNEGEIVDSSDPEKIGKRRELKKLEKGIHQAAPRSGGATILSQKPYEVLVPVIVGDEHLGYVQINMLLDNIRDLQHANFIRRLFATCMVFTVGIALTIFLARRYTEPIHNLVDHFKRVSAGDLSVTLPVESEDEIGELSAGFNNMVEKLREREALEKRLYEAEHLSRVGQLASGIAHEIRNPLNYISLAIDHLRTEMLPTCGDRSGELKELTDNIKEELRRANYMVVNFMNYGRPLKLRRARVSYDDILAKVLPLMEARFSEQRIRVELAMQEDLPPLWVDQELLRNCILNFITNAGQAMPDGGTITLGATVDQDRPLAILTFQDQGIGIREEDIAKIFQPYFTTKDVGIGLGLAITERIIKEHGGEIKVASAPDQGTTFTVLLPLKEQG
ncbi:ATP-binding protein [Geobacter sp. SVR]|uniref:sensor histidine kinase n=1 Tax=Geobacter sp. SVR TaxID=2495594 RepID=UPI00143EFA0A|nr:ATP-binding protein [Geobacter sp. SVR]BCS55953.1 two-component sensor histidine kinase [Geobacter sp. SVR]GCF84716.1 two-component sensor histidine kinase [Geobacter sp. SVR]